MADKVNAEPKTDAPKTASQAALAREVLARRVKAATENGVISPRMRRGIERMQEFVGKVGK